MSPDERRSAIVELLQSGSGRITVGRLAVDLNVTDRTIARDLSRLRLDGVEIVSLPGARGGLQLAASSAFGPTNKSESSSSIGLNPFIGRHAELDALTHLFSEAASGIGKVVSVVGEPGIGKTRIASELGSRVSSQFGGEVLWGACRDGAGTPAYLPWSQMIRSSLRRSYRDAESRRSDELRVDLTRLVPEIGNQERTQPGSSSGVERLRLFESIGLYFRKTAETSPLLLVVDDLHWADRSSLLLLSHLAAELADARVMLACLTAVHVAVATRAGMDAVDLEKQRQAETGKRIVRG